MVWVGGTALLFFGDSYLQKRKAKKRSDVKKIKEIEFFQDSLKTTYLVCLFTIIIFGIYIIFFD